MPKIKQIIVIRKDLKMRRGKEIAQGAHAAMDFLVERINTALHQRRGNQVSIGLNDHEIQWILDGMAKVCLQVDSEEELNFVHQKAIGAGLESHLICDSGRTEFDNVPTITACAIGPAEESSFTLITDALELY